MNTRIHGEGVDHPSIAALLHQLGMSDGRKRPVRQGRRVVSKKPRNEKVNTW